MVQRLILIQLVNLTWALILGLSKNLKTEIDNMYQGYWQTTVGFELKGKIIGLIGLGRVGHKLLKLQKLLVCKLWLGVKI